jgi:hypothetical protein
VDECEWERRVSRDVAKAFWESLREVCQRAYIDKSDGHAQVVAQQPVAAASMRMARSKRIHPGTRVRTGERGCKDAKAVLTSR